MFKPDAPSNARAYARALPGLAIHARTHATYRELLTFFLKLTLVNAREKKPTNFPPPMTPAPAGATRPAVNHA